MDKYFEEDKAQVISALKDMRVKLAEVCDEHSTKEQVMSTLSECIKQISVLGFNLKHVEGVPLADVSNSNKPGMDILKAQLKAFCEDIDQSVEDTSWIEDTDTYAEKQRVMVDEMFKNLEGSGLEGAPRALAEQQIEEMRKLTPPEGAADWVVREMRNEMLLMGIKSHLHSNLIAAAEL